MPKTNFQEGTTVLIEPRIENKTQNWPEPQITEVKNGLIKVTNNLNEPIHLKDKNHVINVRRMEDQNTYHKDYKPSPPTSHDDFTNDITINKESISTSNLKRLQNIIQSHKEVFNKDLTHGYNHASGKHFCKLNWASSQRPQSNKVKTPIYNSQLNVLLQEVCDQLTDIGVLSIPHQDDVQIQAVSPCFLRKKQKAKSKPNSELKPDDIWLVVNTNQVSEHLKNMPTKITKQQDVFMQMANWKHIIKTDLYQGFFQNHLHPSAYSWCAIQTPFGGLRYFKRSIQGLLAQSEEQDEMLSKVLAQELKQGKCIKIADAIIMGGTTETEALDNLAKLNQNNLKLSPNKTIILPKSVDILSWVWNQGGFLTPSAHRQQALKTIKPENIETIKDLCSWIGLYKTFLDCTPNLANLLAPFDEISAGKDSKDIVTWTPNLTIAFRKATDKVDKMEKLYLPKPDDQLIITTDAARVNPGLGMILQARSTDDKMHTVKHYSIKLKPHIAKWQTCDIEAAAIGTAIQAFNDFIRETRKPVIICTDSKPVMDAAKKIKKGNFSLSPRIQTFLNNLSRLSVEVQHISGKTNHNQPSDFMSRNTTQCLAQECQIYVNL